MAKVKLFWSQINKFLFL